ncbi:hypothetical protein CEE36_02550 [candidate division TA06 bacterium B3_TA06]|uniref:Uncharacterized protein n=1 Tax=candidate division TA06 bacterium B3_TA06 TaxID=2012487 RepID=A0A532VA19_UNCT6|nr:MAG: hypothetical protein CEE36_02550 [candidate division TA06 bacterium B3_TA06]
MKTGKSKKVEEDLFVIPDRLQPWLVSALDQSAEILHESKNEKAILETLKNLFERITFENLNCEDAKAKACDDYLKEQDIHNVKMKTVSFRSLERVTCSRLVEICTRSLSHYFDYADTTHKKLLILFNAWYLSKEKADEPEAADLLLLKILNGIGSEQIRATYEADDRYKQCFMWLDGLGWGEKDVGKLYLIGSVLEKLGALNWDLTSKGLNYKAQAQNKLAQAQLEKEVIKPLESRFEKVKKETEELDKKVEIAKDNEQRMTRNFVQIIGIFAAIIAFIVTIVPTAVRMGGASIPVALAGLAIVTTGIIILLSMIFGRDDRRENLKRGFWVAIGAFAVWFAITIALLFITPESLRPPPDASRVDTIYQSRVDTVQTIIIKPE